jgi:hypothetical protein
MVFNTTFNNISVISWRSVLMTIVNTCTKVDNYNRAGGKPLYTIFSNVLNFSKQAFSLPLARHTAG